METDFQTLTFEENTDIFHFLNFDNNGDRSSYDNSPVSSPPFLNEDPILDSSPNSDISSPEHSSSDRELAQTCAIDSFVSMDPNMQLDSQLFGDQFTSFNADTVPQFIDVKDIPQCNTEPEKPTKGKRGRKRQRKPIVEGESTDISAVQLSREQLLNMASSEFEERVKQVTATRPLTAAEEREVKRQKRLIKNRESAQASRQRKKEYVDELEAEITSLKNQNSILTQQVHSLVTENMSLKNELQQLHTLVKKTGLSGEWESMRTQPLETTQKMKTVGVCLLIVMFSFGLFMGSPKQAPFSPSIGNPLKRIDVPEVIVSPYVPNSGASLGGLMRSKAPPVNRELFNVFPEQPQSVDSSIHTHQDVVSSGQSVDRHRHIPSSSPSASPSPSPPQQNKISITEEREQHMHYKQKELVNIESEDTRSYFVSEFMNETTTTTTDNSTSENSELFNNYLTAVLKERPNTAFFTTGDFRQIIPETTPVYDRNSPLFLSLFVPAKYLPHSGRIISSADTDENNAIEITCQLLGINHTNFELPTLAA